MRNRILKKIFLRENYQTIENLKYLLKKADDDFVDEISKFLEKNVKTYENKNHLKEDIEEKKKKIINVVSNIEDQQEIDRIFSYINRKFIKENIREFMMEKIGSVGHNVDDLIVNIIIESPSSYESKIDFITHLKEKKYIFDGEKILQNKKGNFYELVEITNQCFESIKKKIVNLDGSLGFKNVHGAGELYFSLFGKNIKFSLKSDLNIGGLEVELKSSRKGRSGRVHGGKFSGTSFYGNMSSAAKYFFESLIKEGIPENEIEENKKEMNLNAKGLTNLNNLIKKYSLKYEGVFNVFRKVFKAILIKMEEERIDYYISRFLNSDGTVKIPEFIKVCGLISFEYYKSIENFDLLMMINVDSGNYLIIYDAEDLEKNLDMVKFIKIPLWSEGRKPSISPEVIIL